MKRFFRTLTLALVAFAAAVACAFAAVGCGESSAGGGDADYVITVELPDGGKLNGQTGGADGGKVQTQICEPGEGGQCIPLALENIYPDENGRIALSQGQVDEFFGKPTTSFEFHVLGVPGCLDDCKISVSAKGSFKLTLTAAA